MFARSEGNPFFTEELLAVVRAGSRELPATLRDLLRGRVQELPEPAQHILKVVAVAGRRVPHRLLATVAGVDELWEGVLGGTVRTSSTILAQPDDVRRRLRDAVSRRVEPYRGPDGLRLPVSVVIGSARR